MKTIPLTQGKMALVDEVDFKQINQYKWYALKYNSGKYRAVRTIIDGKGRRMIYMHREIMDCPKNMQVDHENHNGLDNRRHNLRICTHSENNWNQLKTRGLSQYKGVSWHKTGKKWRAYIALDSKYIHLGFFNDEASAAFAYDKKAKELFGRFASLNFN